MWEEKLYLDSEFKVYEEPDNIPQEVKNKLKPGDLVVKATTITSDFLPSEWLPELAESSENQRLLWRHKDPESELNRGHVYGNVLKANVIDLPKNKKGLEEWLRVYAGQEGSPEQKLQKLITLKDEAKDPLGISKGFLIKKDNKTGDIFRVIALEDSFTYKPKCKSCKTIEVIQMEDKEIEKEIEKLQEELNASKMQLEEKDKCIAGFKDKIEELESIVNERETEKVSLEDSLIKLSDEIKELKATLAYEKKAPYLEQLKTLEDPEIFELIQDRDVNWMKDRINKLEKRKQGPQIVTKTVQEEKDELDEKDKEIPDVGNNAFRNNPELQEAISKLEQEKMWY